MSTRVAPIFPVSNLVAALAYYHGLGFGVRHWHSGGYGFVTFDGAEIHLGVEPDLDTRVDRRSTAYLFVEDADALYAEYAAQGVDFTRGVTNMPWHSREFVVKDCDGRLLAFGANL